ncbi:glycoside hydrolase family 92 protein [Phyllobacterium sp. LjRoot231]|uniref:glycoside hydrolase domain-containing protein n=1 Tax=Phyllobacterium sp. LjRoot231 TaxID=3342289 RepID=UPI003ECCB7D0
MIFKKTLFMGLLGCTILAGCNGSDNANNTGDDTFSTFADLNAQIDQLDAGSKADQARVVEPDKLLEEEHTDSTEAAVDAEIEALKDPRVDVALTQFVNLFVGTSITETGGGHSGNVNPGAQTPFGMVSFGPDTVGSGQGWGYGSGGYYYTDNSIQYFSMTHLNGPGCRGQGAVVLLPKDSSAGISTSGVAYSKSDQSAEPGYYKVKFGNGIVSELTATTRTGMARLTYADKDKSFLVIDSTRNNGDKGGSNASLSSIQLGADNQSVSGQSVANAFCSGHWKQPVYFHAVFDKKLKTASSSAKSGVATLQFDLTDADRSVQLKIGISSVSAANAKLNLEAENKDWSFDAIKTRSSKDWNSRLNTIQVDLAKPGEVEKLPSAQQDAAKTNLKKFYTAYYRVYSGPTVYIDVNGDYRSMKQTDLDQADIPTRATVNVSNYKFKLDGKDAGYKTHYSGLSMWDTYRSQAQLVALIAPDEASEMMQSLVADAQQCGALPHWVDGSEDTTPMNGDHAPNVIAGSYAFGARKFDLENARKYMRESAFETDNPCNDKRGVSVADMTAYLTLGYIVEAHKGSTTLEMITSDRSIGAFLSALPATKGADQSDIASLYTGEELEQYI